MGKVDSYPELERMLYTVLFVGKDIPFNTDNQAVMVASMFGFVKNMGGNVALANRIFEIRLYNRFLSVEEMRESDIYRASIYDKNQFMVGGYLNMRLVLEKFVGHFDELYGDCEEKFIEESARKLFLLYLRPIINGAGNYYIEIKIWRGKEYHERGEKQIVGYLEDYQLKTGYMLSFCFNKKKKPGVYDRVVGDKKVIEAVV